ncbi:PD40 domain-containing protein [Hyphobacterium sp. CCMP332]|nr:PD40 domain-containing protein [Hyphobacterium sp. CCMP332]
MIKKILKSTLLVALCLAFFGFEVKAQNANEIFGMNRVNYKKVDWDVFVSENFEIYYYRGGQRHARFATLYAESQFKKITDLIDFSPYTRIRLFIYNSKNDLKQSNIDYSIPYYEAGGETNLVNRSIEVAFPGTNEEFEYDLKFGIAKTLINEMMYGGSFKDVVQSSYLLSLPTWFVDGAAEYASRGWSIEMDDYVRDLIISNEFNKPSEFDERDAKYVGQSLWNYIAIRFGKNNVGSILNLTRVLKNTESSISNTLGIPYQALINEWKNYYAAQAYNVLDKSDMPEEEYALRRKNRKHRIYHDIKFSPDGNYLAYSENNHGKYKIYIKDLITGKKKSIYRKGFKNEDRRVNYEIPILAWQNNQILTFIDLKNNQLHRFSYNTEDKKLKRYRPYIFSNISDASFSDDGTSLLLSAERNGMTDIYIYYVRSNNLKRITADYFDDIQPEFFPNSNSKLIFASNRTTDTLKIKKNEEIDINDTYNLFIYDPEESTKGVSKETETFFQNKNPIPISDSEVLYLSDINGIFNVYKLNLNSGKSIQLTDYQQNIKSYDYNRQTGEWVAIMRNGNAELVYHLPSLDLERDFQSIETDRNNWMLEGRLNQESKIDNSNNLININRILPEKQFEAIDKEEINLEEIVFESEKKKKRLPEKPVQSMSEIERILSKLEKSEDDKMEMIGPFEGQNRIRAENIIFALVRDNLRGLGTVAEYGLSDLFGNHKFKFGGMLYFDLNSHDVYAEYKYLKSRVDISARFDRRKLRYVSRESLTYFHDYYLHEGSVDFSYPINDALRVSAAPVFTQTRYRNTYVLPTSDFITNYLGARWELVYDNSITKSINLKQGTRFKIALRNYQGWQAKQKNFSNFYLDFRNYQPIHNEITLATRISYGNFFGRNPKNYLLGGIDNWFINNNQLAEGPLDPNVDDQIFFNREDLLFTQYATTLRGFPLNKVRGNEYFLANAELRIPIFKYLSNKPIGSGFFRNMQLTGFTDFGTAWTGINPLNPGNTVNKEIKEANPFIITTNNYQNPFLYSYGMGIHTTMLGYYVKTDLAYGVENYKRQKPVLHFSLGYDF